MQRQGVKNTKAQKAGCKGKARKTQRQSVKTGHKGRKGRVWRSQRLVQRQCIESRKWRVQRQSTKAGHKGHKGWVWQVQRLGAKTECEGCKRHKGRVQRMQRLGLMGTKAEHEWCKGWAQRQVAKGTKEFKGISYKEKFLIMYSCIKFKLIIRTPTGAKALLSLLEEKLVAKQNFSELNQLISFYINVSTMTNEINQNLRMHFKIRTRSKYLTLLVPFLFVLIWSVPGLSPHSLSLVCSSSLHLFLSEPCRSYLPFLDK